MEEHLMENGNLDRINLLDPKLSFKLSPTFSYGQYIETERELWALFPETIGKRVHIHQLGLTAWIFTEILEDSTELKDSETYFLLPCADHTMRSIRMRSIRPLTLTEYRWGHLTTMKLSVLVQTASEVLHEIVEKMLGREVFKEAQMHAQQNGGCL